MLKLQKTTLTELTTDQMSAVVGGTLTIPGLVHIPGEYESCFAASCITND